MIAVPPEPFQFGGRLALDFTWTMRYRAVAPTEMLVGPEDLRRWLLTVELPSPPRCTARELNQARALREAIVGAAGDVIANQPVAPGDRDVLNRCAAQPPPVVELGPDGVRASGAPAGKEVASALSAIARDAIELLTSGDGRLRRCEGPLCSLLFHDDSRPGTRRWCATNRCGNRVNTRAYRQRRNDQPG